MAVIAPALIGSTTTVGSPTLTVPTSHTISITSVISASAIVGTPTVAATGSSTISPALIT